jgi:hypothetical protein
MIAEHTPVYDLTSNIATTIADRADSIVSVIVRRLRAQALAPAWPLRSGTGSSDKRVAPPTIAASGRAAGPARGRSRVRLPGAARDSGQSTWVVTR